MTGYESIEGLRHVLLENSYVLNVTVEPGLVSVEAHLVLLAEHHSYSLPKDRESQCFRLGHLRFEKPTSVGWVMPVVRPAIDRTGEIDWGGVDHFEIDDDTYELVGDFGRLAIVGGSVHVEIAPAESPLGPAVV